MSNNSQANAESYWHDKEGAANLDWKGAIWLLIIPYIDAHTCALYKSCCKIYLLVQ